MGLASWTPNQGVNMLDDGSHHHGAVTLGSGNWAAVLEEQRNDRYVDRQPVACMHAISYECD
jgi:hypothetical protein